ncbi:phage tail family protein [Thermoanaerobacterium thermosaccharolyticum]|uniref:distal tail protein Dit n=1 Tax=Thermoanaerobacterium thermosaccharolyticum TaxID=1517 RepID=UPI003DA95046
MSGFVFNGVNSDTFGIIVLEKKRPVLPEINDNYLQILGRHGSYLFPKELGDRIIEIDCALPKKNLEELRSTIRDIAAWLYTTERKPLSFMDETDKYYMAKLDGAIDMDQILAIGQFTLRFRCDPFAYGEEINEFFEGDTVVVNNPGTFDALPVFEATFTATASEWKASLGTKYVRIVYDFHVGDKLTVNCDTGTVLINEGRALDKLDWQNSEFFALPPGENTLAITPTGICTAIVTFKPRWL